MVFIPVAAAIYIASTRYVDRKHEGFDVLFGSAEGLICAGFAFRWYHLPIRRGAGWAWAPRNSNVAFGLRPDNGMKNRDVEIGDTAIGPADIELHDLEHVGTSERRLRMHEG